jgi:beta-lactamase class A
MGQEAALQKLVNEVTAATIGVQWSICVTDANGTRIAAADPDRSLRIASVGKLLLLIELAAQLEAGAEHEQTLLARDTVAPVGGSGLLQHLTAAELSVHDLAVLVAAVSDNYATNLLLARVGLERVQERADSLGLTATTLHDQVRDRRGPDTPATLARGSAAELTRLLAAIAQDELVSPAVSQRLRAWLSLNADTSMVASAFDLDPLEHSTIDHDVGTVLLFNKTGTDHGIRADAGWVQHSGETAPHSGLAYAAIADWDHEAHDASAAVLAAMRLLGQGLKRQLAASRRPTRA